MGTVGLFIVFVIHLWFSEATELCGNIEQSHECPPGDCTGTKVKVCIQFDHIPVQQYDRALVDWRKVFSFSWFPYCTQSKQSIKKLTSKLNA